MVVNRLRKRGARIDEQDALLRFIHLVVGMTIDNDRRTWKTPGQLLLVIVMRLLGNGEQKDRVVIQVVGHADMPVGEGETDTVDGCLVDEGQLVVHHPIPVPHYGSDRRDLFQYLNRGVAGDIPCVKNLVRFILGNRLEQDWVKPFGAIRDVCIREEYDGLVGRHGRDYTQISPWNMKLEPASGERAGSGRTAFDYSVTPVFYDMPPMSCRVGSRAFRKAHAPRMDFRCPRSGLPRSCSWP